MKTNLLKYARRVHNNKDAPEFLNRHNQKQWAKAIVYLGDKWLLAKPVERRTVVQ